MSNLSGSNSAAQNKHAYYADAPESRMAKALQDAPAARWSARRRTSWYKLYDRPYSYLGWIRSHGSHRTRWSVLARLPGTSDIRTGAGHGPRTPDSKALFYAPSFLDSRHGSQTADHVLFYWPPPITHAERRDDVTIMSFRGFL